MAVATNVIFIWSGTNGSIPSGWTRNTDFDDKYAKGTADATNPNDTGGNATHTHSAAAVHAHTANNHTHTFTLTANAVGGTTTGTTEQDAIRDIHSHASATSGALNGGGLSSIASTYAAFSNNPPYYTVIYCKSDGTNEIGDDMIGFADADDKPTGWEYCDGNNGSPNLVAKYLLGASAAGNGGSTGGTLTDVHDLTHTHTVAGHTHDAANSSGPTATQDVESAGGSTLASDVHVHSVTLSSTTDTISATAPELTTAETDIEPAYTKIMAVQNQTSGDDTPLNIIGMWVGTLASIPLGWALCDGTETTTDMRGQHLKSSATVGEVGDTGGSNTHTHASQTHTHTASGTHTHAVPEQVHSSLLTYAASNTGASGADTNSTHAASTSGTNTTVYANGSTSASSSNGEPPYRTVAFIKWLGISGGSFLLNFI